MPAGRAPCNVLVAARNHGPVAYPVPLPAYGTDVPGRSGANRGITCHIAHFGTGDGVLLD
jgi:hypothetical protein